MYEAFFGLHDKPFNITPDPRYLYLADSHEEALSALLYGIREKKGLVTITGPVGVGKTTILFSFFERIDREAEIAFFPGGITGNRTDFFRELCVQFGLPADSSSLFDLTRELQTFTASQLDQGRSVIVLVDEAQDLGVEELNNFRYMNNLETPAAKFLQIVLTGTEDLDDRLRDEKLLSLRQRVAIRCEIRPLDPASSIAYVLHRLRVAGSTSDTLFTPGAFWRIVNYARGIPRRINVLCDNAMIIAFALKTSPVDEACVIEAMEGLEGEARAGEAAEIVSREEVETLLHAAARRLEEKVRPGVASGPSPDAAPPDEAGPRQGDAVRAPAPGPSARDMEFPRKVSILSGTRETDRRTGVIWGLVLLFLVLAGLVAFFMMRKDAREGPAPLPPPMELPAVLDAVPLEEALPAEAPAPSGAAGIRENGPEENLNLSPMPVDAVKPEAGQDEGRAVVSGNRGLGVIALERFGTLTLEIFQDLRARNPDIPDWNRLGGGVELLLEDEAVVTGDPVDFFSVQVISYRREENTLRAAGRLCGEGMENVFIISRDPSPETGPRWYSCCVGIFVSVEDAAGWRDRMRASGFHDAFIDRIRGLRLPDILYPCEGEG